MARWLSDSFDASPCSASLPQLSDHGTLLPRLDWLREQRMLIPDERPTLRVVGELLQLHRRDLAELSLDVRRHVVHASHVMILILERGRFKIDS